MATLQVLDLAMTTVKWDTSLGPTTSGGPPTPALDGNGNIIYLDANTGKIVSANLETGTVVWTYDLEGVTSCSSFTVDASSVYTFAGQLLKLSLADGSKQWRSASLSDGGVPALTSSMGVITTPATTAAEINVFSFDLQKGTLQPPYAAGATGTVPSPPAIFNNRVVYAAVRQGQTEGSIVSLSLASDGTFTKDWTTETSGPVLGSPAIDCSGNVYVGYGGASPGVQAWNSKGTLLWTFGSTSPVKGTPSIGKDGTVYVVDENGLMSAITASTGKVVWTLSLTAPCAAGMTCLSAFGATVSSNLLVLGQNGVAQAYSSDGSVPSLPKGGPWTACSGDDGGPNGSSNIAVALWVSASVAAVIGLGAWYIIHRRRRSRAALDIAAPTSGEYADLGGGGGDTLSKGLVGDDQL